MNLTPNLLNQIRETLRDCGLIDNDRQLRALFVDPRIRAWRDRLPTHSPTLYDLFNDVINLLHTKHSSAYNENGLVLFLEVVAGQIPDDDLFHNQVLALVERLRAREGTEFTQVRISTDLPIQEFVPEDFALNLSKILDIFPGQIRVVMVKSGSDLVTLEMPEYAAKLLIKMFLDGEPQLKGLSIRNVELRSNLSQTQTEGQAKNLNIVLLNIFKTRFNKSELRELCFHLKIDYEDLDGSSKADKARELVLFMERRDQLLELAAAIKRLRPDIWPPSATPPSEETTEETPIMVKADAGPLLFIVDGRIGKWQLQVINQGNIHLRQVTLVLRPPPTITTGSNRIFLGVIEAGETISIETPLIIRPNQQTIGKDASLPFEVVCRAPQKMERYAGTFIIPIEEGESS